MASESPINLIRSMKQQGLSNRDIIQNLTRQGFSNTQIFDALNHIDTKNAVESSPTSLTSYPPNFENNNKQNVQSSPPPPSFQAEATNNMTNFNPKTEELIETIIDEKWEELIKDINKVIDWKNRSERRIQELEVQVKNLKKSFEDLHNAVIGKVSEYDKHILDVGSEIKAMEKVFSKVLPRFTENVHELSRITDKFNKQDKI
ncbi:hypothetical protein GF327_03295 [Candidatus Woesearchaeota archaeon]|nr:hypothetical protein [Candidatus Woesearchaeota archaeon]